MVTLLKLLGYPFQYYDLDSVGWWGGGEEEGRGRRPSSGELGTQGFPLVLYTRSIYLF